jgi:hypothetical protein
MVSLQKGFIMRSLVSTFVFASTSFAATASALADDQAPKLPFALMDNTGDGSKIDLDIAAIVPTDGPGDGVLLRSRFLGQAVAQNGLGAYAGISASTLVFDNGFADSSELGNLELGGLYQRALSSDLDLGMRIGLVLPTANDSFAPAHVVSTLIARPADLVTAASGITWLRLGISPTYHRGPLFARVDLGIDVPIIDGEGADPVEHLNLGVGVKGNAISLAAELQTVFLSPSFHTAALTARYHGKVSPHVSVSMPLDDVLRAEVVTVTAGLTVPF